MEGDPASVFTTSDQRAALFPSQPLFFFFMKNRPKLLTRVSFMLVYNMWQLLATRGKAGLRFLSQEAALIQRRRLNLKQRISPVEQTHSGRAACRSLRPLVAGVELSGPCWGSFYRWLCKALRARGTDMDLRGCKHHSSNAGIAQSQTPRLTAPGQRKAFQPKRDPAFLLPTTHS